MAMSISHADPTRWRLPAALLIFVFSGSGCFGSSRKSVRAQELALQASSGRSEALDRNDFASALAYDDFLVDGGDEGLPRTDRKNHFARWLEAELAKLGPPREDNVQAIFGTLVAFRREARRAVSTQPAGSPGNKTNMKQRQEDLAVVDADLIAPQLAAVAVLMWKAVDGAAERGEFAHAITLGQSMVDELAANDVCVPRLAQLKQRAAALHLALAQEAGDRLPGARVLHARLAAIYGAQVGALAEPGPALLAETTQNWTLSSPGNCGDSVNRPGTTTAGLDGSAATYREAPVNLAVRLRSQGFAAGSGQPMSMTVTFDSCPVSKREFKTEDKVAYQVSSIATSFIARTREVCSEGLTFTDSKRVGYYHQVTTTKIGGTCKSVPTGEYDTVKREVEVTAYERVAVSHRVHRMSATGVIQIAFEGGTRQERFTLDAESEDDRSWSSKHRASRQALGLTEGQVRDRLHGKLLAKIRGLAGQALADRAAAYTKKAQASIAQGQAMEADQAFFVADRIVKVAGKTDPLFTQWMQTKHRVTSAVFAAAIAGQGLPKQDVVANRAVHLPAIAVKIADDSNRELRSEVMSTLTGGPSSTATAGGNSVIRGGILSGAVTVFDGSGGGGLRMHGGWDGAGNGLMDMDILAGYGAFLGWLQFGAIGGLGVDFTPGNDDRVATSPNSFLVPAAGYLEYGARMSYALPIEASIELMYTKVLRYAAALPQENRGDIRLAVTLPFDFPAAFTLRYTEYRAQGGGYLTPFDAGASVATSLWLLGGFGY